MVAMFRTGLSLLLLIAALINCVSVGIDAGSHLKCESEAVTARIEPLGHGVEAPNSSTPRSALVCGESQGNSESKNTGENHDTHAGHHHCFAAHGLCIIVAQDRPILSDVPNASLASNEPTLSGIVLSGPRKPPRA